MSKLNFEVVHISEQYFKERIHFQKMLDPGNHQKQERRRYLFLKIKYGENNLLVPLRKNLGDPIRKYGVIGFSVPSQSRPNAGLDYRYILIVNDDNYFIPEQNDFSKTQQKTIKMNYDTIEREAREYVDSYVRAAKKSRAHRKPRFRESSLINFHIELGIEGAGSVKDVA